MSNLFRDAPLGQIIRFVTRNRYLKYPEEEPDFKLPKSYVKAIQAAQEGSKSVRDESQYPIPSNDRKDSVSTKLADDTSARSDASMDPAVQEKTIGEDDVAKDPTMPKRLDDGTILVDWYGPTDLANPHNWTSGEKIVVVTIIVLYTLTVYLGSSIITPSYFGIMEQFDVSLQTISLTLSMYVLAYGLGPMLWSPLSEVPSIGRNPPYIITFAIYCILIVPTALADNFAAFVVLRFLLGFFGSPALASGAASMGDFLSFAKLPYGLSLWALAATSGPAIAPAISGFSVPAMNWRWASWEMLWLSGPIWIAMFLVLPETSTPTILLRRAQRLRALTGNNSLKSQSEIDQSRMQLREVVIESLWRPGQLMVLDPSIAFTAVYSALIYGIFYSFFECFPLVFGGMHGFNLGEQGLVFLSINVGVFIAIAIYWSHNHWVIEPELAVGHFGPPERRLVTALPSSILLPVGLFIFAWTASPDIHWIAPTMGIVVLMTGLFIVLQCIFLYLPLSYPQYSASLFAGNDIARSALAAAAIHFSQPLFHNLGVNKGVTLLACLTVACIAGVFILWKYGDKLRARSRFAL